MLLAVCLIFIKLYIFIMAIQKHFWIAFFFCVFYRVIPIMW